MKTYIFYAVSLVLLFVTDILTLRSGLLGSFERGLAITALFIYPLLFLYAVARVLKLREEQNWVAKFDEA